ncbi:Hypothetical protein CINCED_3A016405 [Cinara cedri]|uniref:Rad51-like C-terminal domain-containing protein n=1 Tax=Cinara cedri TaxID=506608 RepID=A0A5E4M3T5_9HEMI|nr:Hypothetical protein CINCED_3A016405 [Cinara cedri]
MIRLKVPIIPNESILNNLLEKNICTVNDFLQKKTSDLQNICNLQCKQITKLKDDIIVECSSPFINGYTIYIDRSSSNIIQTGILKLDNLLGGGLFTRQIYEFCGPSACGKTQLTYITRIKQILKKKYEFTNQEINSILRKVHVYSVFDLYSLITCLYSLKEKSKPVIFIDSLPALYLSFVCVNNNDGLCYMNHICSVLKYLSKQNATIIVTNLAIKHSNFTKKRNANSINQEQFDFKPTIGKYWIHIPNTRLMLTTEINREQKMCITIGKSVHIPINEKCILNIDDCGVL